MSRSAAFALLVGVLVAVPPVASTPARAEPGDPLGWSVAVDPRGRAFLKYVAENDGRRLLVLGCLRDVDSFTVLAELPAKVADRPGVALKLSVADASWSATGAVEASGLSGTPEFSADLDFDREAATKIAKPLLRVLTAPGPIVLQVGDSDAVELPLEALPPHAGIAEPLKKFEAVCFRAKAR